MPGRAAPTSIFFQTTQKRHCSSALPRVRWRMSAFRARGITGFGYIRCGLRRDGENGRNFPWGVPGRPGMCGRFVGGPDYWQVNLEQGRGLNLRDGPSTRYASVGLLRAGTPLENRGCRMTGSERWCNIRAAGSGSRLGRRTVSHRRPCAPAAGQCARRSPGGRSAFRCHGISDLRESRGDIGSAVPLWCHPRGPGKRRCLDSHRFRGATSCLNRVCRWR